MAFFSALLDDNTEMDRLQAVDEEDVDMDKENQEFVFIEPPIREDAAANRGEEEMRGEQAEAPERQPEEDDNDPDVQNATRTRGKRQKISQLDSYSSLLHVRHNQFNDVLAGGMLTQQYMVDSYVKIESNWVNYLRVHQSNLHVKRYKGLTDYLNNRADRESLTMVTAVILPSSFIGSPSAQKHNYQGALCITGKFKQPTLFLTMTCNPKWPEIFGNLLPGKTAADRPDLVPRVFNLKLKALIADIEKGQIFGQVVARIHVIEFQKRDLPHCHMLIWIRDEGVPKTEEIPDKETNSKLHVMVMPHLIYGPCGKRTLLVWIATLTPSAFRKI